MYSINNENNNRQPGSHETAHNRIDQITKLALMNVKDVSAV
jgi:hypothetical protein